MSPSRDDRHSREDLGQEVERLLDLADSDPEASAELDFLADVAAAAEREREHLGQAVTPALDGVRAPAARRRTRLLILAVTLTAAASLFVVLSRLGSEGTAEVLGPLEAPVYLSTELRDDSGVLAAEFAEAMEPYLGRRYDEAADRLRVFLERNPAHVPARFYLAASLETVDDGDAARDLYRGVAEEEGLLGEHALWRLAHLEFRGNPEAALQVLRELAARAGRFADLAEECIESLEDR